MRFLRVRMLLVYLSLLGCGLFVGFVLFDFWTCLWGCVFFWFGVCSLFFCGFVVLLCVFVFVFLFFSSFFFGCFFWLAFILMGFFFFCWF